jgi:hypothetical protein
LIVAALDRRCPNVQKRCALRSDRPTRARRPFDASVDPTDARNSDTGFRDRPTDSAVVKPSNALRQPASLSAAHRKRAASTDPDLALVNYAWDRLPEAVRAGIVARVRAASGDGQ